MRTRTTTTRVRDRTVPRYGVCPRLVCFLLKSSKARASPVAIVTIHPERNIHFAAVTMSVSTHKHTNSNDTEMLLNELHTTLYHFGCPLATVQLLGKRIRKAITADTTQRSKRRRRPTLSAEHLVKHLTKLALDIYEARGLCFRDANLQARRDAYERSYKHYRSALCLLYTSPSPRD